MGPGGQWDNGSHRWKIWRFIYLGRGSQIKDSPRFIFIWGKQNTTNKTEHFSSTSLCEKKLINIWLLQIRKLWIGSTNFKMFHWKKVFISLNQCQRFFTGFLLLGWDLGHCFCVERGRTVWKGKPDWDHLVGLTSDIRSLLVNQHLHSWWLYHTAPALSPVGCHDISAYVARLW